MGKMFKVGAQGSNSIVFMSYYSQTNFAKVKQAAKRGKGNVMRRAGAIVRGIMRRLIRHRKNPRLASPVGTPPYAHFLPGVKNTITFEAHTDRVIIGPQIDASKKNISPVPGALEYGGYTLVKTWRSRVKKKRKRAKKGGVWIAGKYYKGGQVLPTNKFPKGQPPNWYKKKNPLQKNTKVRAFIRPRPFANPAMKIFQTSPLYKEIWKDCIK